VNLLRSAVAAFSAGIGGASAVTVRSFDSAIGRPDEFGRRTARSTQLLLIEESGLARVVDPAGGSWFVEDLTEQLAEAAWERFRSIEADGGMVSALASGRIAAEVDAIRGARAARLATRAGAITGVTEFPDIDEVPLVRATGPAPAEGPLRLQRLAGPFEALRDAGESVGPVVRLVPLGPLAEHSARTTFAANLFAVAGIRTTGEAGSPVAVLCGSDQRYAAEAVEVALALKAEGVAHVLLAGRPGDNEAALREAGIDEFVHARSDILEVLGRTLDALGVAR
jgi:methylmalonyl-CoA mutase